MKHYAGIGSRETPAEILDLMKTLGTYFARKGYTLRSGHADGADLAFEIGACLINGPTEIYLPWSQFNYDRRISGACYMTVAPSQHLEDITKKYHPAYESLTQGAQKLMMRNCHQILGKDLNSPVDFVVCYTPKGSGSGGTGQALRIAKDNGIPIFDFGSYSSIEEAKKACNAFIKQIVNKKV